MRKKLEIEITENHFSINSTIYKDWVLLAEKSRFKTWIDHHDRLIYDCHIADYLYNEAVKIIQPKAKTFKNIKQKDLHRIISSIQYSETEASGLYLSALLNTTELQEMDAVFKNFSILGYRLATGKRLIVREGSTIDIIGDFCNGDIINFGSVYDSISAERGIQINFGKVFILSSNGGIQLNFSDRNYMMSRKGIQIDLGNVFYMVEINGRCFEKKDFENKKPIFKRLESKLHEIEKLKNLKDQPNKAIQAIKGYDWETFEKEILAIGRQLGETKLDIKEKSSLKYLNKNEFRVE